jgi:cysteine-rich repeat protein
MSRRVLALPWIVGSLFLGCGGDQREFGDRQDPEDSGAQPAKKADGGNETGDAAAVTTGDAGSGATDEGTSIDVSATVTSDGSASTVSRVDGGATGDTSGDDTGTTPAEPTLDGACSKGGVRACDVNDSKQTLVCSQGRWQSNGGCAKKYNCDPSVGACSEIVVGCTDLVEGARYCQPGDQLWECGPNLVSETLVETCEGNCVPDGETSKCASPECGDGKTQTNEACDDANDDNEDACTILCKAPECGDGLTLSTELCDDGDEDEDDDCTSKCAPPDCGDGITQSWEVCDDANDDENDDCTTLCEPPVCGDGIQQLTEPCDDGNADEDDTCTTTCKLVTCGEGVKQSWEACDDGNLLLGDGCSPSCAFEVVDVSSMYETTCARRADGHVKCWGYNPYGQLGAGMTDSLGDGPYEMGAYLPEVDLGAELTALQVEVGFHHGCALLENHRVKCWGYAGTGSLGTGDTTSRGDEPYEMGDNLPEVDLGTDVIVQQIAAGGYHTCAVLSDGRVKCWGYNLDGQLGLGDFESRGDGPDEMGDYLPYVDLGAGRTAQRIAAGSYHTCALLDNFDLKCWGSNSSGQLGRGDYSGIGGSPGQMGDYLSPLDLGVARFAINVFANYYNTCAILDTGALKCWGYNGGGQLGQGNTDSIGDQPYEMGDNLPPIELGYGRTAIAAAMGYNHTCAILDSHELKCWGDSNYGQVGLELAEVWGDLPGEMGDYLPVVPLGTGLTVQTVSAGYYHTCALLSDGNVKCWGFNGSGDLGQGHVDPRGNAPGQMGDYLPATQLW